jgi:hypothetical protein
VARRVRLREDFKVETELLGSVAHGVRLRAERDAVAGVSPDVEDRLRLFDAQLRLERVAPPKPARALGHR